MTKLLKNRVIGGITEANVKAYGLKLKETRSAITPTPPIDDEESKLWDKMGPVKRSESTEALKIVEENEAALPAHLSVEVARNGLSVYDNSDALIAFHEAQIEDLKRLKTIGGATALNMLKCCEEYFFLNAEHGVEAAIPAKNAFEKLPRYSDKKPAAKTDKGNKGDTPTTKS